MALIERTIRFKEWGVWVDTTKRPLSRQIVESDGTLRDESFRLRTNSAGFIVNGNSHTKPGSMRKIIALGGSFVESLYESESERFISQAEREINLNDMNYEIWNGGYSGSTLLHSFNVFMNKVAPLLKYTEKVLIFTAMSDQRTLVHSDSYWIKDKTHAPIIESRNSDVAANRAPTGEDQLRLLKAFVAASRALGHDPVIVCSPFRSALLEADEFTRRTYRDEETYAAALFKLQLINETARKVAQELNVRIFDAELALGGNPEFFYDSMHLNQRGHKAMGSFLANQLQTALT